MTYKNIPNFTFRDILEYASPSIKSKQEIDLNQKLFNDQKQCIMPDIIFNHVNERIRFEPRHGPKKYKSEPLVSQRMYITHENIDIVDIHEDFYNQIDKPTVAAILRDSKNAGKYNFNGNMLKIKYINFS